MRPSLAALILLVSACGPTPPPVQGPLSVEAGYRLLFNETLVGNALFVLRVGADGSYRIDAFTTPAGQMENRADHEVLETSWGVLEAGSVRPERFEHSVMHDGKIEVDGLRFDWARQALQVQGREPRSIGLLPGTHDRLSYLLAARRLADAGEGRLQMQVVSTGASEQAVLEVTGKTVIEVPYGRHEAVAIRRDTPGTQEQRQLWFDTAVAPLPLRVVHERDGSLIDMQLVELSRGPSDPR